MADNDPVVEWGKWTTGLSLFSASGCVGILVGKLVKSEANFDRIKTAVVFFLATIFVAWIMQLVSAMIKSSASNDLIPVSARLLQKFLWWLLVPLQLLLFLLSLAYLASWITHFRFTPG